MTIIAIRPYMWYDLDKYILKRHKINEMEENKMLKKSVAMVLTAALTLSAVPGMATEDDETHNNAVSGYVSLNTGVKIVGKDKTPKIYIDDTNESVQLAAENMKSDIEAVTSVIAQIVQPNTIEQSNTTNEASVKVFSEEENITATISEINTDNYTMTVANYETLTKDGRGIIAVYNK